MSVRRRSRIKCEAIPRARAPCWSAVTPQPTALYESRRVLFWGLLPIAVSLSVGAVYFGYHYVTDVLAGAGVGFVAVGIDRWRMSKRATAPWAGG